MDLAQALDHQVERHLYRVTSAATFMVIGSKVNDVQLNRF